MPAHGLAETVFGLDDATKHDGYLVFQQLMPARELTKMVFGLDDATSVMGFRTKQRDWH